MVGLLRLRFAAGVCVLAAGLLMGAGGAVAVADPGSSGSAAHGDDGTNASGQQNSTGAKKPKDEPGGTDTKDGWRAARTSRLERATRPAAFHRREKAEGRAWRHGHQGRDERRLGPRCRGCRSGRRGSERGRAGFCGGGAGC